MKSIIAGIVAFVAFLSSLARADAVLSAPKVFRDTSGQANPHIRHLFIHPDPDAVSTALESWSWNGIGGLEPIRVTVFGDVFFVSADGVVFLDMLSGKVTRVCDSESTLDSVLLSDRGLDLYLMRDLADAAFQSGMRLSAGQCFDFRHPPCLGGKVDVGNLKVMSFSVSTNIAGQIHQQIRDLPEGAPVPSFKIVPPEEKKGK